jgi:hypothetical protein
VSHLPGVNKVVKGLRKPGIQEVSLFLRREVKEMGKK